MAGAPASASSPPRARGRALSGGSEGDLVYEQGLHEGPASLHSIQHGGSRGSSMGSHRALSVDIVNVKILRRHAEYTMDVFLSGRKFWTVERRYTHFRLVHKDLKRQVSHKDCILSGMAGVSYGPDLPRLPSRVLVNNLNRAFVESRRVALQIYLEGVLRLYGNKIPTCVWELLGLGGRLRAPVLTKDATQLMESTHGLAQRFKELHASVYASVQASVLASHAASGHASLFSLTASSEQYSDQETRSGSAQSERRRFIEDLPSVSQGSRGLEEPSGSHISGGSTLQTPLPSFLPGSTGPRHMDDEWLKNCEALFKNCWNSA